MRTGLSNTTPDKFAARVAELTRQHRLFASGLTAVLNEYERLIDAKQFSAARKLAPKIAGSKMRRETSKPRTPGKPCGKSTKPITKQSHNNKETRNGNPKQCRVEIIDPIQSDARE